jgi:predicted 2-oxoglutarate/Fe(II)-dependent dioxygenase YbiX
MNPLFSAIDPQRPVYNGRGLLVAQNYLDADGCAALIAYAERTGGKPAPVGDPMDDGRVGNRQDSAFTADRIDIQADPVVVERSLAMCRDIYANGVSAYFGVEIEWFEVPHILRYHAGGNYIVHSDSENWDELQHRWVKGVDRDFSSVLYLNSGFTGGALAFPNLNLRLHPQAGLLVTFPSDHRFMHAAEETLTGIRYAFVTWAARKGIERVMQGTPPHIVRLSQ